MQKHNENVFINTLGRTFIFKTMDINHKSCPPSYKLSNDLSKITYLHSIDNIFKNMLVELCVGNYATFMVLWMELMAFLKHQQHIMKQLKSH